MMLIKKIFLLERKIYFFISTILSALSTFFINYYLSQKLEVVLYGEFSLLFGFLALASSITLFGQALVIGVVFYSDEKNGYKNIEKELNHSYVLMIYAYIGMIFILGAYWYFFDSKYSLSFL